MIDHDFVIQSTYKKHHLILPQLSHLPFRFDSLEELSNGKIEMLGPFSLPSVPKESFS